MNLPAADLPGHPVLDIPYTWSAFSWQSPAVLDYVARLNRIRPPAPDGPIAYCELGCGNGLTSNVLAASFPEARFYAVDINPEHIANGRRIARLGGLENVTFVEGAFSEMLDMDLPQFDYVTLHGVYSWVSRAVRREIVAVLDKYLRPGGLVYVSYNAMPGWASLLPIRELMRSHTAGRGLGSYKRAARGIEYLKFLDENEAEYFKDNARAKAFLQEMLDDDLTYVAHEYLNESWRPMYVSEVAGELAAAGLAYCGSADYWQNYWELAVPKPFRRLIESYTDRLEQQTHLSLILEERFRRDIYCRAPDILPDDRLPELFRDLVFGKTQNSPELDDVVEVGVVKLQYSGAPYAPLVEAAADGQRTMDEILHLPSLRGYAPAELTSAVQKLVAGDLLQPLARKTVPTGGGDRYRIASAFNRAVLTERVFEDSKCYLATPILGEPVQLTFPQALLLLAGEDAPPGEFLDRAEALFEASGKTWNRAGKPVRSAKKRRDLLKSALDTLKDDLLPYLWRFGIVEPPD